MTVRMTKDGATADIHPDEVENMRAYGWSAVEADEPLEPAKVDLGTDSGDQFSDEQLRAIIEEQTGETPHHRTGRAKLVAIYDELNAKAAGE